MRQVRIHMNTINYVIKVTQAQVFAVSTKIWKMRLVEKQYGVFHRLRQTFNANLCTDSRELKSIVR